MRITILSTGSLGDVHPYVALGRGLQKAGHVVTLATHEHFGPFVRDHGLGFFSLPGDPRAMLESAEGQAILAGGRNPVTFIRNLRRLGEAIADGFFTAVWQACQDADAVLFSALGAAGYHAAQIRGVPAVGAYLQPGTPTQAFPHFLVPARVRLGRRGNRLSHVLFDQLFWQVYRPLVNRWRREHLSLAPLSWRGPYQQVYRHTPMLYGYSPVVLPKPADWGAHVHVTGYWFLDRPGDWQPPAALVDFLASGPAPVYVGFGSMNNRDPEEVTTLVLRALAGARQRGVLATGWGGLSSAALADDVYKIDAVPHDWLFPQMAAVVHHGGMGTTGAGLCAAVPAVIVPFFFDQPFWAERVAALGCGPSPIPRKHLTATRLASAIKTAVTDSAMRRRAAVLGERIRGEDGVTRAVEAFECHLATAIPR